MALLDTHAAIKLLTSKGFSEDQAEAIVFIEEEKADKLVTSSDLRIAIQELKIDMIKWIIGYYENRTASKPIEFFGNR